MTLSSVSVDYVDEIIAVLIVIGYVVGWFIKPMPTEPLMLVLGYYFGHKLTK